MSRDGFDSLILPVASQGPLDDPLAVPTTCHHIPIDHNNNMKTFNNKDQFAESSTENQNDNIINSAAFLEPNDVMSEIQNTASIMQKTNVTIAAGYSTVLDLNLNTNDDDVIVELEEETGKEEDAEEEEEEDEDKDALDALLKR